MNSLDTNLVIRYLLNDIPSQAARAKKIIVNSSVYVTDVVATEAIFVLEKAIRLDRSDVVMLVKAFLGLPNMVYNDYFLDTAIDIYAEHPALSFVDCYAAAEAKAYNNTLYTFDQKLARQGGQHVKLA